MRLTCAAHDVCVRTPAGVVKPLVEIARVAPKEKVFRIALSALRNLFSYEALHAQLASDMVEAGLPKVVATRKLQVRAPLGTWADPLLGAGGTWGAAAGQARQGVQAPGGIATRLSRLLCPCVLRRAAQTWGDEDVVELLNVMEEKLREGIQVRALFARCAHCELIPQRFLPGPPLPAAHRHRHKSVGCARLTVRGGGEADVRRVWPPPPGCRC